MRFKEIHNFSHICLEIIKLMQCFWAVVHEVLLQTTCD